MKKLNLSKTEFALIFLYFSLYFIIALSLLFRQPFGNPPDEINRYLIPQYIADNGVLPNGYDESIRIPSYGFSYAFQPILPYMVQGYAMRAVSHFTTNAATLFYTARLVDFFFGLIMAVFVLLLGRKWFRKKPLQYVFSFFVMFLPQSIFLHTYVNTDSCCMMSIAIILYALTLCLENHFSYQSSFLLSIGIILCAMSYYNAYGYILSCILLFIANYLTLKNQKLSIDFTDFMKKGGFICVLVLLGIGWWFVRSYLLYDGDFLGLRTRDLCGALYGNENMRPGIRVTYKTEGYSVLSMLLKSDFLVLSINSLIAMYGPMIITTARWIYRFYKLWFLVGLLASTFLFSKRTGQGIHFEGRPILTAFFHGNMILCMILPLALSIIYSYQSDYQPQGRYLMPLLVPLCYYCVRGFEKCILLGEQILSNITKKPVTTVREQQLITSLCGILILLIVVAVTVTVYGYAFPYWATL